MSDHGSWWPSQVMHLGESLVLIWFPSWFLAMYALYLDAIAAGWCGAWVTFCASSLAEGKSIGGRMYREGVGLFDEANRGDWIDYGVHNLGWIVPLGVMYAVIAIFGG